MATHEADVRIVYSQPAETSYQKVREFDRGDTVAPQHLTEWSINVAVLLP